MFFFAFLPQFVRDRAPPQLAMMLTLSAAFMAMTFLVFALYGVCAAAVRQHLIERPRIVIRIRRLFAACFFALGLKLAGTAR